MKNTKGKFIMELKGKTAVVTGGASGIGRATANTLAMAGAYVLIGDISDEGQTVASEIRERNGRCDFIRLDVTDLRSIALFREQAFKKSSQVDIVANVAGWGKIQPFLENTPDFWRKVIDLNLFGPIAVTHAFLGSMVESGSGGKVVTVSSDAGRVGSTGETVYSGAKGGAIAFTKSLAREVARHNITVNCVCPGPTDTPLLAAVTEKHREAFIRATPMRRLGEPSEVAEAVLFFSSDRSSFVTGQVLSVSGGLCLAG